ncbi:MAG: calcium/sodium antiporter [Proteobacteria bacterium]|nr:calcium/sodium antiporter [Pseudomonadota bacterium]MCZ6893271.1 calcium/sodium antiporter [Gammaproteobacteria bacterium]
MLEAFGVVCVGLILLTYGADRFVDGAAATAANFGVQPLLIGLVIVGFATSTPEMLVSGVAALNGNPTMGIGNAIGSNIANIGLVLGVTAILAPLTVRSQILQREFPIMFAALLFASFLLWDRSLTRVDGVLLVGGFFVAFFCTVWLGLRARSTDPLVQEFDDELAGQMSTTRALFWIVAGLAMLLMGSNLLVSSAVEIARHFGLSDIVIGLTIVAVGTSLPELAASIISALKNQPEIALGNIIGSNMFNALGVLATPALIRPTEFGAEIIRRDVPIMLALTVALFLMSWSYKRPGRINRIEGMLLLSAFIGYQYFLF